MAYNFLSFMLPFHSWSVLMSGFPRYQRDEVDRWAVSNVQEPLSYMFPQLATILVAYPEQIRCIAVSSLTVLLCTRIDTCVAVPRYEKRMTGVDEKLGSIGAA